MATVANLVVGVQARTKKFRRPLKKAQRRVKQLASQVQMASLRMAAFGAAMTAAAVGGAALLAKASLKNIDATSKLSDRINATTQGLVGLQHAANIYGATNEDVNKGLEKMQQSLGQAISGLSTQKRAFNDLNLSAKDLSRLKAEEIFLKIAAGMKELPTAADRMRVASDVFGRSGKKMLNLFAASSSEIQNLIKEAGDLGITFDRLSGAHVEAANDALDRMGKVMTGLGNTMAIGLSDHIVVAARNFQDLSKVLREGDYSNTFENIADSIIFMVDSVSTGLNAFKLLGNELVILTLRFQLFDRQLRKPFRIGFGVKLINDEIRVLNEQIKTFQEDNVKLADSSLQWGDAARNALDKYKKKLMEVRAEVDKAAGNQNQGAPTAMTPMADQFGMAAQNFMESRQNDLTSAAKSMMEQIKTPLETWNNWMLKAEDLLLAQAITVDQFQALSDFGRNKIQELLKGDSMMGTDGAAAESRGFGAFRQVDVNRVGFGGPQRRTTKVEDPQLVTTNKLLKQISSQSGASLAVLDD